VDTVYPSTVVTSVKQFHINHVATHALICLVILTFDISHDRMTAHLATRFTSEADEMPAIGVERCRATDNQLTAASSHHTYTATAALTTRTAACRLQDGLGIPVPGRQGTCLSVYLAEDCQLATDASSLSSIAHIRTWATGALRLLNS